MTTICFYFQVHQPHRIGEYSFFDIDNNHFYHDAKANCNIMRKVAHKCYLPTNQLMLELIERFAGKFKIAYSITGTAIEQFKAYSPETLESFQKLVKTGCVELINETYYHSLSFLYSKNEFIKQVQQHQQLMLNEFNYLPTTFRNTELIYNNDLARCIQNLGFKCILAEGADKVLEWRSPNFVYQPIACKQLKLLLKNYQLSDDIAFRFSNRQWQDYPLTADKFAFWVHALSGQADVVNLFMDYETFGEHQWEETGIFNFLKNLPECIFRNHEFEFATPREVAKKYSPIAELDIPYFYSWADTERDLSAWLGNDLQQDAIQAIYQLEKIILEINDPKLIATWRTLQTSDHFYYMCTKWFEDGDVHKYFNHFSSPYDAYISYQNIIADFMHTLHQHKIRMPTQLIAALAH